MPRICLAIFISCVVHPVFSQPAPAVNRYLGIKQGLSNNSVRCIFQDQDGFMWFGTYDGLNRYDGYSFKIFRNIIGDTSSLPHNYINAIGEDFRHNLVVGTGQGVTVYNGLTQNFSEGQYIAFGHTQKERVPFNVNTIKTDAKGNLYMTTNGGGLLVKANGSSTALQIACGKDEKGACANDAHSLVIDGQQRIWLMLNGAGLFQYLPAAQKLQLVSTQIPNVRCMEADDAGNLWIGTYDGVLYQYNIAQKKLTQPYKEQLQNTTFKSILSLAFDAGRHQLWIGTEGGGINILNTSLGTLDYLLPGEGKNVLSSETVYAIYNDREHRKWIGTHKGGIDIIDPQQNPFQTISHDPLNRNSLVNNFIASFYEDSTHNLWIGTDGGGISVWNRSENRFTNYQHRDDNPQSLSNNSVPGIVQDYGGNTWIATFGGGINRFNKVSGTFQHYPCIIPETGGENNYVWKLLEDGQHTLWATTYSNGRLYRLNRQTDRFEMFSPEPGDFFCLADDGPNTLWAGSAFGLCKIDKRSRKYSYFPITKPVRAIYKDRKGRFWIGAEGLGLILFDKTENKIAANYTTTDGLCNNSVLNILEDNNGNLWLSTFHGLSQFNPSAKTFKNYYAEDGLQSNQFEYNAALRLQSGEMVFGGINGFSIFQPNRLAIRNFNSPVLLTGLRINNTDVAEGSPYVTAMQPDGIAAVRIPYNEASLSFDFAALEYSAPGKINYAYYLQGWDKGWNYTSDIRSANYTRLGDGTYTLHIKATNAEGVWNPGQVSLQVVVLPPWYRSWWAYLLYAAIVAGLIYAYNTYRVRKANLEYEVKLAQMQSQKEKELAQLEIRKEKEINEKRLSLFTDISHEFRTPLTLIINPVKEMLDEPEKPKDHHGLNAVHRNARRLLSLVDQLLLFRKAETSVNRLKVTRLNFCTLCKEVYLSFVQEARSRNISYHYNCPSDIFIYGDRQKIEIALYNLLSNAVKYTPYGGKINFEVAEAEAEVTATVADSGPGISKEAGNSIFNKFYQVIDKDSVSKPGFGIGLSLVKNIAESHQGSIRYESEPGQGATFILTFPKGREHFKEFFIAEEAEADAAPAIKAPLPAETEQPATKQEKQPAAPAPDKRDELVSTTATLLVAEDDEQLRKYILSIFSGSYKVYEAYNAEQALQIAREQLPDLVISDNLMGGMTGMELCTILKKDAALGHIPVIILTGSQSPEGRLKGMEHGADDYITKPFEKDFLVARVANLLQSRSMLQNYFYNEVTLQKNTLKVSEEYKLFLENCIAIVEKHLDDDEFSIKTLATEIGMSHSKLYRIVKSVSGQSVNAFIRFIRLRKAAELLINTNMNVNETSYEVGISDVRYFRTQFHKLFGMNPSEYIKKYRKAFSGGYRLNKDLFKRDTPEE